MAVTGIAAAFDDNIGVRLEQADEFSLAGTCSPFSTRRYDPLDERPVIADLGLPKHTLWVLLLCQLRLRLAQMGSCRARDSDQLTIEPNPFGLAADKLNGARPFFAARRRSRQAMALPPSQPSASFSSRTITRTASHSRLLSLGSCMRAAVTVLSSRMTLPVSTFFFRALRSSRRLIASQVPARIAPIVLCSDAKGEIQAASRRKDQGTDAGHRGGNARSRNEGAVMALNQRGARAQ